MFIVAYNILKRKFDICHIRCANTSVKIVILSQYISQ
jgi:hypothetical protein